MNDEAKKLHLDKIDVYFGELKTNKDSANTLKNIENELNLGIFHIQFELYREKTILKRKKLFYYRIT